MSDFDVVVVGAGPVGGSRWRSTSDVVGARTLLLANRIRTTKHIPRWIARMRGPMEFLSAGWELRTGSCTWDIRGWSTMDVFIVNTAMRSASGTSALSEWSRNIEQRLLPARMHRTVWSHIRWFSQTILEPLLKEVAESTPM